MRRELQIWVGISPLIWRDLALPWSSEVISVDASPWGLGATSSYGFNAAEIQNLGRFSERWRFDVDDFKHPRASAFGVNVSTGSDEADALQWAATSAEARGPGTNEPIQVVDQKPISEIFQQTPFSSVQKPWSVCGRYAWKRSEPMPVLEGRASLFAVKRKLRSVDGFHRRHLFLTDSITAACSLDKGRGSSFKMRRVTQQIGAMFLASGSTGHYRWIPSEWNPADGPSRGSKFPSIPKPFPANGDSSSSACGPEPCETGHSEAQSAKQHSSSGVQEAKAPTAASGGGITGSRVGGREMSGEIPGLYSAVLRPHQPESQEDQVVCSFGRRADVCPDRDVWRRGRHQSSKLYGCRCAFCASRVQDTKDDWSAKHKAESSRVAQAGSTQVTSPSSLASGVFDVQGGHPTSSVTTWIDDATSLQCISQAGRIGEAEGSGLGATCQQTKALESDLASTRGWGSLQDRGVRRDSAVGSDGHHPSNHCQASQGGSIVAGFHVVQQDSKAVERFHDKSQPAPTTANIGGVASISSPTWRCKRGLQQAVPNSSGDSEKGAVEVIQQCEKIRKRRAGQSVVEQPASKNTSSSKRGRGRFATPASKPALSVAASLVFPVFLEIFSGSGHLANSISKHTAWPTLLWDIFLGEEYDLRSPKNRRLIASWLRGGHISGLHLGTPCESFTRARDVPPGPPPLRSDQKPLGLDGLKAHDQLKVMIGNLFMRFSVFILLLCGTLKIPASLENPAGSRLWICPPVLALLRRRFCRLYETHYCFWGKPFKKATKFLSIHVQLRRLEHAVCKGGKRGICIFTGRPHQQLSGKAADGRWKTKVAEPYPTSMCEAIAKDFKDFEVQQIADRFSRHTSLSA